MKIISVFYIIFFLVAQSSALNFRRVTDLNFCAFTDRPFCFDTNHDGKQNLILSAAHLPFLYLYFYEYIGYNRYILEDSTVWTWLYDVGYLDSDSLVDMLGNINGDWPYPLYVYESPTYNSNPTNIVWQDSGFMNIYGGYITDLDQDGLKEILFGYCNDSGPHTCVYENTGDNQYALVWQDTLYHIGDATIYGDFDLDGKMEFIAAFSGYPSRVLIWECHGDNEYGLVYFGTLPGPNAREVFSANDMDGNGKPEFLVTCVSYLYGEAWLYLFESIGDNNYDFFLVDSITNLWYSLSYQRSFCGDIDADGKEEIVWSTFNQWHVYKATGVNQYQRSYSSDWDYHDWQAVNIYDLNGNGYPEVIESWYQNGIPSIEGTTIWEIQGVKILQPNYGYFLHPGEDYQIIWQKFDPPGADSFALFFSSDSGNTYDTIAMGIPGNDTVYQWVVPDVISDSCKIMIWAYGPPRPGEHTPRGVAWDFGDFKIVPVGIETDTRYRITDASLKILQIPVFNGRLKIRYAIPRPSRVRLVIYNVLGQIAQVLVDENKTSGIYEAESQRLTSGVYFVKLITDKKTITKKGVIVK